MVNEKDDWNKQSKKLISYWKKKINKGKKYVETVELKLKMNETKWNKRGKWEK